MMGANFQFQLTGSHHFGMQLMNKEINGGLLYIKGGEFSAELKEANISYWRSIPMKNLLPSLPSDKQILYIPTKEIQTFKQRLDLTSKK